MLKRSISVADPVFEPTMIYPLGFYVDPGSGLLIWQVLLGLGVGAAYRFRRAILRFVRRDE